MPLLWKATLSRGAASLKGNCAPGVDDFCVCEVVRAAQAQVLPGPVLRLENNFHDGQYVNPYTKQTYTEQRAMCDVAQIQINNGDEIWWRVPLRVPADWVGWFPKWDELGNWPGDSLHVTGGHDGGSAYQIHHMPPNGQNGDWSKVVGSAPLYIVVTDKYILAKWVNENQTLGPAFPLVSNYERGRKYDILKHIKWSPDPTVGFFEAFVDGKQVVPLTKLATSYHNVALYPIIGFYRRQHIGDPALTWPADAKPGVAYPPDFTPRKGARVFAKDDGYPQSLEYPIDSPTAMAIGTTREDVMATPPAATPAPAAPGPGATSNQTPFDPNADSVNPNAGAKQLENTRNALLKEVDAINALLGQGKWKPT